MRYILIMFQKQHPTCSKLTMCIIKTYYWKGCGCAIRQVPIKCVDSVIDPYRCPRVEWKGDNNTIGTCGCDELTASSSSASDG
jgi:hypothetical protein